MKLHLKNKEFRDLITLTAEYKNIPESAVKRDYFIVMILQKLQDSTYANQVVFKGGTSLSKCYPNSIERFSEDIDLTFIPSKTQGDRFCDRELKIIESIFTLGFQKEKILSERNQRNKSIFVWTDNYQDKIKIEIGSHIQPYPYAKKR